MNELHYYAKLLELGRISRREFIGRAVALGTTVALATTMAGKAIKAATPKKGGRFRLGLTVGSTTDTLDPATIVTSSAGNINICVNNHLMETANTGELIPELAESYEASDDAVQWTFKLRQGVEFHNGKTLDANDVVASINHHRGDDSKSAAKTIVDPIADIKADGKDTVVVTLNEGNADFPFIVSEYHLAIKPANADGSIDWQSGVGTGGYILQNFDPGVQASFTRNPNYWKEGRAHFDEIESIVIADVAARTNALTTGEIDAMNNVDLKTLHLLEQNTDIEVAETTGFAHYVIPMRTDTPPFDDNNVRLALKYSVDREAMVRTIVGGHGAVGNDHPISPATAYYAADIPQRVYDPDKSKFHLKQAGLTSLTVDLSAADAAFPGALDVAVLYKEHAKPAGIEINVIREPNDGYWSNVWMNKPWCMSYWDGRPTPDWMFSTAYASGAGWNETFWEHERFNKLLVEARPELDQDKRGAMYAEMQLLVRDEGGVVVPMFNNYVFAMRSNVKHDVMAADFTLDGGKCVERWWFG